MFSSHYMIRISKAAVKSKCFRFRVYANMAGYNSENKVVETRTLSHQETCT